MISAQFQLDDLYARLPVLNCKGKCQASCGPIVMSQVEAERIKAMRPDFITRDMEMRLPSGESVGIGAISECLTCPLLTSDGKCSVYPIRPLICRMWGSVQAMRCPYGCTPRRWVSPRESAKMFRDVERISKKAK